MGTRILLVLEQRHNGDWIAIDTFGSHESAYREKDKRRFSTPVARTENHKRFFAIGRWYDPGGLELRGFPEDASDTARLLFDSMGKQAHRPTWLGLEEACRIFKETDMEETKPTSHPALWYFNFDHIVDLVWDDYRLVVWFDN